MELNSSEFLSFFIDMDGIFGLSVQFVGNSFIYRCVWAFLVHLHLIFEQPSCTQDMVVRQIIGYAGYSSHGLLATMPCIANFIMCTLYALVLGICSINTSLQLPSSLSWMSLIFSDVQTLGLSPISVLYVCISLYIHLFSFLPALIML